MGRRLAASVVLLVAGCSKPNPVYGLTDGGSAGGSATSATSMASTTTVTTTLATSDTTEGSGSSSDVEFTDDSWPGEFAAGTPENLRWTAGNKLHLQPSQTAGTLDSRIFDAQTEVQWTSLEWIPLAPYGKALPGAQAESGYDSGNVDMTGSSLLLHFDDEGPWAVGDPVVDSSSVAGDGVVVGENLDLQPEGLFGGALLDASNDGFVSFDAELREIGTGDFTWSLWARFDDCAGARSLFAMDSPSDTNGTMSVWLGCSLTLCDPIFNAPTFATYIEPTADPDSGDHICADAEIADPGWHHYAAVKRGHDPHTSELWVDGALETTAQVDLVGSLDVIADVGLTLGGGSAAFPTRATFDEVAMWNRALSPAELEALRLRGVRRLRFQVRACKDAGCMENPPFVGPDASPSTYFVDPDTALSPGTAIELPDVRGRYVQYRVLFDRERSEVDSPALGRVTLRGTAI